MEIREGKPGDRDAIVAFDEIAGREETRVRFIERSLRSGTCLVGVCDGNVSGYAVLEYTFFDQGFVSMLCVAEPVRRRGLGRALMRAVEERCRTPKLFTSTNQSNRPMQRFLASLGYSPSGVILNLDPGDPELIYFRDLSQGAP